MVEVTSVGADECIGRSLYHFCHVNDLTTLRQAHIEGGTLARMTIIAGHALLKCALLCNQFLVCVFTAQRNYASAVLGVVILSVRPSVCRSVIRAHAL